MRVSSLERILKVAAAILAVLVVTFIATGAYLYALSKSLPDLSASSAAFRPAQTTVVYASDGTVLAEWHAEQDRTVVSLEQVPKHLQDAVVAIEDERFYEHEGVDFRGIARALRANASSGEVEQGGSTITQQVVKLLFTDGKRTLNRKVKEALLAYQLEARTSKQKVLETYLNLVYFGEGAYGVESAAKRYFGKHVGDVDLAEAALLAGIIASPGRYDPVAHPDAARERRDRVLDRMRDLGYISEEQRAEAAAADVRLAPRPDDSKQLAPYFVEHVKQQLIERLGSRTVFEGGLRVYTTLDPRVQRYAEDAARALLPDPQDPEVALVCIDHRTGDVLAMVGGRDFSTEQFNLAVQGRRQPGSAFKPFVLVTALEQGVKPSDVFDARPYVTRVKDGIWRVQNYENEKTAPSMTLAAATTWSVNAVYARLVMRVGAENVVKTAQAMGITTKLDPNPAIALGGLTTGVSPYEMAGAYSTLASGGIRREPVSISRVTDSTGNLVFAPVREPKRVLPASTAKTAAAMLHDVVEKGTGQAAKLPVWAAGKTGTTQAYRDAWFVGWADGLSTAVWVGYREGQVPMTDVHGIKVTGGSYPARIWQQFMSRAIAVRRQPQPSSDSTGSAPGALVRVRICTQSMLLANDRCPDVVEIYLDPAIAPTAVCTEH
ncbi:PBP1A family penicillin-binding protein [Coriobacteriia bacterium Es71-Z0120]|uniref:transglycosylase domain-containing protein n=1 Tax=Parvivirga hydrogeniphila TaxID=2939460 RepID=UPI002260F345|nr:PBP1A family penicillin-binding protein [Parvivirga hydrogeniphila]MCL4078488.1 PBP1A family penicillin-binding protein [Parvivirga hydrogeniphila]